MNILFYSFVSLNFLVINKVRKIEEVVSYFSAFY